MVELGKYHVESLIAEGGMAQIFRADLRHSGILGKQEKEQKSCGMITDIHNAKWGD